MLAILMLLTLAF